MFPVYSDQICTKTLLSFENWFKIRYFPDILRTLLTIFPASGVSVSKTPKRQRLAKRSPRSLTFLGPYETLDYLNQIEENYAQIS